MLSFGKDILRSLSSTNYENVDFSDEPGCVNPISSGEPQAGKNFGHLSKIKMLKLQRNPQFSGVLFIGPGMEGEKGKLETLNVRSLTKSGCNPAPPFPGGDDCEGYVATLTANGTLLCGGRHHFDSQSSCWLLDTTGAWREVEGMTTVRIRAAAVELDEGWWVTGRRVESLFPYPFSTVKMVGHLSLKPQFTCGTQCIQYTSPLQNLLHVISQLLSQEREREFISVI